MDYESTPAGLMTAMLDLHPAVANGFAQVDRRFAKVEQHFANVDLRLDRLEVRITSLEGEVAGMQRKIARLENGVRDGFARVGRRIDALEKRRFIR